MDDDGVAESSVLVELARDGLTETLLVSAYDVHHGHLGFGVGLTDRDDTSLIDQLAIVVVDSGGYETGIDFESGHIDRTGRPGHAYVYADFEAIVDGLSDRPHLVVSYDGPDVVRGTYADQLSRAQQFFATRPQFASDLLLKPPDGGAIHQPHQLAAIAHDLAFFDVIGLTEKELGASFLERMINLALIRRHLDDANIVAPIHVFGALDPIFTPLYFAAGGEIFDGLSWLRYSFDQGLAVHPEIGSLLRQGTDDPLSLRTAERVVVNLNRLREMRRQLERYAATKDVRELGSQHEILGETISTMIARISKGVTDGW